MAFPASRAVETIVLPRWLRWIVYGTTAVLFVTGALWLLVHYGLGRNPADDLPHPVEPWLLRVHGLAMMAGLFVYGALLRAHMVNAWKLQRNRATGILVAAVLGFLAVTGYMLYYASGETTRPVVSAAHWIVGLVVVVVLPLHIWRGRRRRTVPG